MPYSTQADIEGEITSAKLVELTDDDGDGVADTAIVTQGIAWADRLIDSYAAGRYAIPFTPATPPEIADRSKELAVSWFYRRRQVPDESIRRMHDAAIAWLRDLQAGTVNVTADLASGGVGVGGGGAATSKKDTIFDDDKQGRF